MVRDRTKTIFERRVGVYMPTLEAKAKWNTEAKKRRQSLSDMVYQIVESHLWGPKEDKAAEAHDLQKELGDVTSELARVRDRVQQLEALNERSEKALEDYRAETFLEEVPVKKLDRQLVHLLSSARGLNGLPRAVRDDEIRQSLKIGPRDETRLRALNKNLVFLEQFQLVKKAAKGWVWNA